MSTTETKPSPTSELAELTRGTAKTAFVTDKSGTKWQLIPLDMADICEYEDTVGASLFSEDLKTIKTREIMFLLFLSLRKTGCSVADLEAKKFKWANQTAFLREFDIKAFIQAGVILGDLLKISGLDAEPAKTDPPAANQ